MTEQPEPNNTELVLPIICPTCKTEINLAMAFSLLPPGEVIPSSTQVGSVNTPPNVSEEEE